MTQENPTLSSSVWKGMQAPSAAAADADRPSDEAARFITLAEPRLDRAYRLAGLILGSSQDAEDAVQEALVAAWRSFGSLRQPDRFGAWFDRILVNGCRDVMRRRKVVRFVAIDGSALDDADPFAGVFARDAVLAPVTGLPLEERAVVVLHYWADLPLEEVAERLAIPIGTVKSRLHRALERLRAEEASR